ncbi:MAG: amidohydrolase family protein, partial [Rhodospirillaceae bacterium]|nr:amidohydrolase family protein [Rhodospirillaceae bacterium]
MSQPIDALICPRWTIAVEPDTTVKEALCLAVQDGKILELLPRELALERYAPIQVYERPNHVLMPGLVNAHTHAAMTLMRGFADDLPLKEWLTEKVWPTEMRFAAPEYV